MKGKNMEGTGNAFVVTGSKPELHKASLAWVKAGLNSPYNITSGSSPCKGFFLAEEGNLSSEIFSDSRRAPVGKGFKTYINALQEFANTTGIKVRKLTARKFCKMLLKSK